MRTGAFLVGISSACLAMTLLGDAVDARSQPDSSAPPSCEVPEPGRHWLQQALDGWSRVRVQALGLNPAPLPWLVLFDERCVWHLSPDRTSLAVANHQMAALATDGGVVSVFGAPHTGQIALPNGRLTSTTRATASTSVYADGSATFSLVSMFGVWQRDPRHAKQPRLGQFFQGLLIHELTHSTQLVGVIDRLAALRQASRIPGAVDDDIVQRRFGSVPQFRMAIDAERNLFYRAARSVDKTRQREWVAKGLSMARKRRARFYTGHSAAFGDLEDVFLAMEGSAQWAAYRWARWQSAAEVTDEAVIRFVRADRKYWSQDEGLALYLLIDALVPEWQKRTFGETMTSPFVLLEESLKRDRR